MSVICSMFYVLFLVIGVAHMLLGDSLPMEVGGFALAFLFRDFSERVR